GFVEDKFLGKNPALEKDVINLLPANIKPLKVVITPSNTPKITIVVKNIEPLMFSKAVIRGSSPSSTNCPAGIIKLDDKTIIIYKTLPAIIVPTIDFPKLEKLI